jgi:hypothetical protein
MWAFTSIHASHTGKQENMQVFARTPYNPIYQEWADMFPTVTQWNSSYDQHHASARLIE